VARSASEPRFSTSARPPNVPLLSCGRIRKPGGIRWQLASPWYITTGEKEDGSGHDEVRPSAFNGLLGGARFAVAGRDIHAERTASENA
jgi:hypothetical protein